MSILIQQSLRFFNLGNTTRPNPFSHPHFSTPISKIPSPNSLFKYQQIKYKIHAKNFHSTPINQYDIATLMRVFGRLKKTKKEERLEREAKKGKLQDHSKIKDETIKERILNIATDMRDPLKFEKKTANAIFKDRNANGSILDRYCHQFGVDPNDANTKTRIAQLISRTLKKDIREMTNEEYIATKRNTLTRLLASSEYHGIFPALLPTFTPTINLCIQFSHPVYGEIIVYRGNTLTPTVTSTEPKVIFTGRTDFESFYTLVMVDLDYPSIFDPSGRSFIHWVVGNIPNTGHIHDADKVVPFLPPIPPVGTKIHRIAFVLFQQTHGKKNIKMTNTIETLENREKFDIEQFAQENHLLPVGLSFFQTKWDEEVTKTYENLGLPEPQYVEESRIPNLARRFITPQQNTFNFKPVPLPGSVTGERLE